MNTQILGGEARRSDLMGTKKPFFLLLLVQNFLLLQLIYPGSETGRGWDIPCVTAQLLEGVAGGKSNYILCSIFPSAFFSLSYKP